MHNLRRFALAFWLAAALLIGQQVAILHDLAHATELRSKGFKSAPSECAQCLACAQLSGALGVTPTRFIPDDLHPVLRDAMRATGISEPLRLAFRSRAPPRFS